MKHLILMILLLAFSACNGFSVPGPLGAPAYTPSPSPLIQSPTLPFSTLILTSSLSSLTTTSTNLPTETTTPTPTTLVPPDISLEISGCNTSLDISHNMGEVTNAYILVKNHSNTDQSSLCATLTASDESRLHPDKTACVELLPGLHQVALKLTVDTEFDQDTSIQVFIISGETSLAESTALSCQAIVFPGWIPSDIGKIIPIP